MSLYDDLPTAKSSSNEGKNAKFPTSPVKGKGKISSVNQKAAKMYENLLLEKRPSPMEEMASGSIESQQVVDNNPKYVQEPALSKTSMQFLNAHLRRKQAESAASLSSNSKKLLKPTSIKKTVDSGIRDLSSGIALSHRFNTELLDPSIHDEYDPFRPNDFDSLYCLKQKAHLKRKLEFERRKYNMQGSSDYMNESYSLNHNKTSEDSKDFVPSAPVNIDLNMSGDEAYRRRMLLSGS